MPLWISVAGLTDVGRQRELNEDSFYYKVVQSSDEGPLALLVVADGMGGHLAGEVASQWAVGTLKRELAPLFRPQDPLLTRRLDAEALATMGSGITVRLDETDLARLLEHAVTRANQVLLGYARKHSQEAGDMGSTLTLAVVEGDRVTVAHVGDSRAYLWRQGFLCAPQTPAAGPGFPGDRLPTPSTRRTGKGTVPEAGTVPARPPGGAAAGRRPGKAAMARDGIAAV